MSLAKIVILILIGIAAVLLIVYAVKRKKEDGWENVDGFTSKSDRAYSLNEEDEQAFRQIKSAVYNAPKKVERVIRISPEWYKNIDSRYRQGYTLYMNAIHPTHQPSASAYTYFKSLYYRSVNAGKILHEIEKDCQRKVSALQALKPQLSTSERQQVDNLINRVGEMQAKFEKLRRNTWNNTHGLKMQIARCGTIGAAWYRKHEEQRKQKYGC